MAELRPIFTNIADAIREKNKSTDIYTPEEMPTAIASIPTGVSNCKAAQIIDRSVTEVNPEDFGDATKIGEEALSNCHQLTSVIMSDNITNVGRFSLNNCINLEYIKVSKNLESFSDNVIDGHYRLKNIDMPTTRVPQVGLNTIQNPSSDLKIKVLSSLYNDYLKHSIWGSKYKNYLIPDGKWIEDLPQKRLMEINSTITVNLKTINYTIQPNINIVVSKPGVLTYNIKFIEAEKYVEIDFTSTGVADAVDVTLTAEGDNGDSFTSTMKVNVVEKIEPGTYTVESVADSQYSFVLNEAGYYESNNKGIGNSYAYAKVNIHNPSGLTMYVDCINYGESDWDYGMLSYVNAELTKTINEDGIELVKKSFKGLQKPDTQTVIYDNAIGDCFITVKFRKDSSGDQNNDSLQFKIRFE